MPWTCASEDRMDFGDTVALGQKHKIGCARGENDLSALGGRGDVPWGGAWAGRVRADS